MNRLQYSILLMSAKRLFNDGFISGGAYARLKDLILSDNDECIMAVVFLQTNIEQNLAMLDQKK